MKKLWALVGLLLLAVGAVALGVPQFLSNKDRADTTDFATNAISAFANAANRVTADRNAYTITVAMRVGQGRIDERNQPVAVQAEIGVRGNAGLTEMCTALPRVRDSITTVVTDRIAPRLRTGHPIRPDELSADSQAVMATLVRLVPNGAVTGVRLVLKPAYGAQDAGCYDRTTARTDDPRGGSATE